MFNPSPKRTIVECNLGDQLFVGSTIHCSQVRHLVHQSNSLNPLHLLKINISKKQMIRKIASRSSEPISLVLPSLIPISALQPLVIHCPIPITRKQNTILFLVNRVDVDIQEHASRSTLQHGISIFWNLKASGELSFSPFIPI